MIIYSPSKQAEEASVFHKFPALELAGWGAVGAFAKCWSLALQQRPILSSKRGREWQGERGIMEVPSSEYYLDFILIFVICCCWFAIEKGVGVVGASCLPYKLCLSIMFILQGFF